MKFSKIDEKVDKFVVWGSWDDKQVNKNIAEFHFNVMIPDDKEKARFLANEFAHLIMYRGLEDKFKSSETIVDGEKCSFLLGVKALMESYKDGEYTFITKVKNGIK